MLLMLLWSQVCSAMPEVHDHADEEATANYYELQDHLLVLENTQHQGNDGSEHELHLHACGGHVVAVPPSFDLPVAASIALSFERTYPSGPVRFQEKLLRPPIA